MTTNCFDKVSDLYEKGFRCIKYEQKEDGQFNAFFKNFEEEKIDSIVCTDENEIMKIRSYIDNN